MISSFLATTQNAKFEKEWVRTDDIKEVALGYSQGKSTDK